MKKTFSTAYRQDYFKGYSIGFNPFLEFNNSMKKEAFIIGFNSGRSDYERMNGNISDGIPERIVTDKVLEDFLIAGMLGMAIDDDDYTCYQIKIISKWYQSGIEKYDPNQYINLLELLEENGIVIN
ncbi:hypothetical protein [Flavobacterium sp. 83]|jgi:hypothetical protein|uniref:hypothetical protein n=1 Tax=Flavobacterium sp. 83 TaxID=1131812 RepID=UPI00055662FB|nr:hypothetical protein [Flavobacterium sp. 83]